MFSLIIAQIGTNVHINCDIFVVKQGPSLDWHGPCSRFTRQFRFVIVLPQRGQRVLPLEQVVPQLEH